LLPIWMGILFFTILNLNLLLSGLCPVEVKYHPFAPKEGECVTIILALRNTHLTERNYTVSLYVDGVLRMSGVAVLPGHGSRTFFQTVASPELGRSLSVLVKVESAGAVYEAVYYVPPYPPRIWSSFAIIGSLSMTLMGYMTTLGYYSGTMLEPPKVSAGLFMSLTLIGLLVFLELSDLTRGRIRGLRAGYGWLAVTLLLVLAGIVLTKAVLVLSGVG